MEHATANQPDQAPCQTGNRHISWAVTAFATAFVVAGYCRSALAQSPAAPPPSLGSTMCGFISGNLGVLTAVASLGVILIGIGATVGRVTWTQAILVMIGLAVMFGYATISQSIENSTGSAAALYVAQHGCQ